MISLRNLEMSVKALNDALKLIEKDFGKGSTACLGNVQIK